MDVDALSKALDCLFVPVLLVWTALDAFPCLLPVVVVATVKKSWIRRLLAGGSGGRLFDFAGLLRSLDNSEKGVAVFHRGGDRDAPSSGLGLLLLCGPGDAALLLLVF